MRRVRIAVALAAIAIGLGWVATRGLTSSLVYYQTPTDVLAKGHEAEGERMRLGGYVLPGSVVRSGETLRFVVSDGSSSMSVVDTGGVPSLFKAGQGVVLEGALGADGAFHADTALVKHSSDYRPPQPGETPHGADLQAGG
jgi:cytochrome c-type biogenesis protein CcmE